MSANGYDTRPGQASGSVGCGTDGCVPALSRDGIVGDAESRWSCAQGMAPGGGPCEIEFRFQDPQDIMDVQVAFYKGDERSRTLEVSCGDARTLAVNKTRSQMVLEKKRVSGFTILKGACIASMLEHIELFIHIWRLIHDGASLCETEEFNTSDRFECFHAPNDVEGCVESPAYCFRQSGSNCYL